MPALNAFPARFRDNEDDEDDYTDVESQASIVMDPNDEIQPTPKWYKRTGSRTCNPVVKIREIGHRSRESTSPVRRARRRALLRKLLVLFAVLAFFGIVAGITYISLVTALIRRLNPPRTNSGLQHITDNWKEPDSKGAYTFEWRDDFSRNIVPKNCHSHNDYWRSVPLYEALAAGCIGIEADIWVDNTELLVSHSWRTTRKARTLESLYLDPLANILTNRNVSVASTEEKEVGVFDADPEASIVLLIDFKSDGRTTWPLLMERLRPFHNKGWLTYFDGNKVVQGPLTIVGTGNTPFDLVKENNTDRFIFFDAPLNDISSPEYTTENSYYASVQFHKAIGRLWFNKLRSGQVDTIKKQIKAAADKGLKSRYWDTPAWPITLRDHVWSTLTANDVGMLNVDDLVSATRWNWNWCVIAGLNLCGNS